MGKKGQITLKALISAVVSGIVIAIFYAAGVNYGSGEAYYKVALAKDIALTIDTLYSLKGDVEYNYPNDISNYDIEIKDGLVTVYSKNSRAIYASYPYAGITQDKLDFVISGSPRLQLAKTGKSLNIKGVLE